VLLGPLPAGEAALYLREHAGLSRMVFSGDAAERALAMRLLNASRFHPLLMDHLARLATGGPALRPQLRQALDTLETRHDYSQLPALFVTSPGDEQELTYLNDALATSLDQLISDASPDARRLLWMIAVANDPVRLGLLQSVWSGESYEQQQLLQLKQMLDRLPQLPAELQEQLKAMLPELRPMLDALPPAAPTRPDLAPLLRHLVAVGLATEERTGPDDANPDLTCHELVRERIRTWMHDHPQDRADLTEDTIRLAYAERLEAVYEARQHQNMTDALQSGSRAIVYYVQAGAYDRLGGFASTLVTSTRDPRLLADLLPHLEAAAEAAPEGRPRWSCLCYLADALKRSGRPNASLPFYAQAATQARTAAEAQGENGRQAWADFAWITGNWAGALRMTATSTPHASGSSIALRPRKSRACPPSIASAASWKPCASTSYGARPRRRCHRWKHGWRRWRPGGSSTAPASRCRRPPIPRCLPAGSSMRSKSPKRSTSPRRTGNLRPRWI
jgi:hypothetical protein